VSTEAFEDTPEMQRVEEKIGKGDAWAAIECIFRYLRWKRKSSTPKEWLIFAKHFSKAHFNDFTNRCPITARCRAKPRGYSGDAVVMDYIYGLESGVAGSQPDEVSTALLRHNTNMPAARAVRFRRERFARMMDDVCLQRSGNADILSVASGHFREVALSTKVAKGAFHTVTAFDQDAKSLAVIDRDYKACGITAIQGKVSDLISEAVQFDQDFDLILCGGLYDYLNDATARKLTRSLFLKLKSGGKLQIANFSPDLPDSGYMEGVMDWWLIYRTEEETVACIEYVDRNLVESYTTSYDPDRNICFLEVVRK